MKVGIYIRVSTEEQAKEGYSINAQKQRLKAYCIAQDWDVVSFYPDEGISAKNMKRPFLKQLMSDVEKGIIDCVLVYRLDRLTRSVHDLYKLLEFFDKYNCKFKSATEVYDTTTAMGRMFITIVAALAQWERENTGERVKMGLQEKARQGKYASNIEPFGYHLDLKTGKLTINEEEAAVYRKIVELYLNGYGVNRICKYLNSRSIYTGGGNEWGDNVMLKMLKNPLYHGTTRWSGVIVENAAPAIIDKNTFDKVQSTIQIRRTLEPKRVSSDYIFSGVLKCTECGNSMVGYKVYTTLADGQKRDYKNYRCLRKKTGQCIGCKSLSEIGLEQAFLRYLDRLDLSKNLKSVAAEGLPKEKETDTTLLLKELEKIEKRKKKWQYAWSEELISDEDFRVRIQEDKAREDEIRKEIMEAEKVTENEVDEIQLTNVLKDVKNNWINLEEVEKKNLIQMFFKEITAAHEGAKIQLKSVVFH